MESIEEQRQEAWPQRPWLMAAIGAVAGVVFWALVDVKGAEPPPLRQAAATFVIVSTLAFLITAERRRLDWAAAFAVGAGAVVALVGWFTASYNYKGEIVEFPFLSALLAVGIAGPLFQTIRDEGRAALPYPSVHRHVWTDAIIGGASIAFTGLTFLLAMLIASLFETIGIKLLIELMRKGWFDWMLAGAAFGAASAVLRERAPLLGTLQRLVTVVFSVLAPVLAASLVLFLLALPATGLAGLWKSGVPETPLLLAAAAFAFVLLNAIIGDSSDDRGKGMLWRATEFGLLVATLPLGAVALVSMGMRVDQYGWTPERLWGVIACLVAIAFGLANLVALARARGDFDRPLRDYQKWLAVGVSGLALLLAMPFIDFGAISSRSQLARLQAGNVPPQEFDWAAMAFDFGPSGRKALSRIAESGAPDQRLLAARALKTTARYDVQNDVRVAREEADLDKQVRLGPGVTLDERLRRHLAERHYCKPPHACALIRVDDRRLVVVTAYGYSRRSSATTSVIDLDQLPPLGRQIATTPATQAPPMTEVNNLGKATIELRDVTRKQVFVDGKPVGQPFE